MAARGCQTTLRTTLGAARKAPPGSRFPIPPKFVRAWAAAVLIASFAFGCWCSNLSCVAFKSERPAEQIRCGGQNVVVRAQDRTDALLACEGARDAVQFLTSQGLDATAEIAIEMVPSLPRAVSVSAAGCYLEPQRLAMVLCYSEFRRLGTWFGIPVDRSLHRSLVAHEVAHCVAGCNFRIAAPAIQAKEYIAYITQFASMEPALRERILSHFQGAAFEGDWQMGTTIYMFDCMAFGVRAYRHFLKLADGSAYLQAILDGRTLAE
jgi:hypothetical protein